MKNVMIQIENKFSAKGLLKLIFVVLIFLISCFKGLGQVINATTYPVKTVSSQSLEPFREIIILSERIEDYITKTNNLNF